MFRLDECRLGDKSEQVYFSGPSQTEFLHQSKSSAIAGTAGPIMLKSGQVKTTRRGYRLMDSAVIYRQFVGTSRY